MTPDEIVATLGMQRHPEGGWFVETFRDGHSTCIYYLLQSGEHSHWHRVRDAAEVWHYYAGSPLSLSLSEDGNDSHTQVLGPDLAAGERPQVIVPANCWQAAESLGVWTLVGCTVAPAFTFESFEMAPPGWRPGRRA